MIKKLSLLAAVFTTSSFASGLYIDYQGLDTKKKTALELRKERGTPDGYVKYSDQYKGVIHEIGNGIAEKVTTFGVEQGFKDAVSIIVPKGWITYVDEQYQDIPLVTWEADQQPWVNVLANIGANHGIKYIVDWEQQVVQFTKDSSFVKPDYNQPAMLEDPNSKKKVFIYHREGITKAQKGFILLNGKMVPVKVDNL